MVTLTVRLPPDIAEQVEAVQEEDPDFLSRVVLYGLTRRSIYAKLREVRSESVQDGMAHVFGDDVEQRSDR